MALTANAWQYIHKSVEERIKKFREGNNWKYENKQKTEKEESNGSILCLNFYCFSFWHEHDWKQYSPEL